MLSTLRTLLGRTSERTATDGGTDAGRVPSDEGDRREADLWDRYAVDGTRLDPALPEDAIDHLDSLLDEHTPGTDRLTTEEADK